jgi:hypothetical protein
MRLGREADHLLPYSARSGTELMAWCLINYLLEQLFLLPLKQAKIESYELH